MAKSRSAISPISGKLGNRVHINSAKHGQIIRQKQQKKTSSKRIAALKGENSRTKFLNDLASAMNNAVRAYSGQLKNNRFYEETLKRFRKEKSDNRFLLLLQLKGMEANALYPMSRLGMHEIEVHSVKNKITVRIEVKGHPQPGKHRANCYYYEVLLLTWNKTGIVPKASQQFSDWIDAQKGRPEFEFEFAKPANIINWVLCLRIKLGVNNEPIGVLAAEGMQIVEAGTFDKKEMALLEKRQAEKNKEKVVEKKIDDVKRVKAKRMLK